jgi:hypothetical protein
MKFHIDVSLKNPNLKFYKLYFPKYKASRQENLTGTLDCQNKNKCFNNIIHNHIIKHFKGFLIKRT